MDKEFKRIGALSQYIHPEHGVIDPFIQKLTGITNGQVRNAPKLQEALLHMIDWIGEREYKIYAWSESDRSQILHEIKAKKIKDARIDTFMDESNWVDYQEVFIKRYKLLRQIGLQEALGRAEIEPEGKFHDGLNDAVNTGKLIEKLELNPEYQLINYEVDIRDIIVLESTFDVEGLSDFAEGEASHREYGYGWTLKKTSDGKWKIIDNGYA